MEKKPSSAKARKGESKKAPPKGKGSLTPLMQESTCSKASTENSNKETGKNNADSSSNPSTNPPTSSDQVKLPLDRVPVVYLDRVDSRRGGRRRNPPKLVTLNDKREAVIVSVVNKDGEEIAPRKVIPAVSLPPAQTEKSTRGAPTSRGAPASRGLSRGALSPRGTFSQRGAPSYRGTPSFRGMMAGRGRGSCNFTGGGRIVDTNSPPQRPNVNPYQVPSPQKRAARPRTPPYGPYTLVRAFDIQGSTKLCDCREFCPELSVQRCTEILNDFDYLRQRLHLMGELLSARPLRTTTIARWYEWLYSGVYMHLHELLSEYSHTTLRTHQYLRSQLYGLVEKVEHLYNRCKAKGITVRSVKPKERQEVLGISTGTPITPREVPTKDSPPKEAKRPCPEDKATSQPPNWPPVRKPEARKAPEAAAVAPIATTAPASANGTTCETTVANPGYPTFME